jgi:thiamine biosynthesis lipoprotein
VAIDAQAIDEQGLQQALSSAFLVVEKVDRLMHPTRSGSDLAVLRSAQSGASVPVDPWTYEVLELAKQVHMASGGVFDPCLPGGGRFEEIQLLAECRVLIHAPLLIDLGGIAKGYAVDQAIAALRAAGCTWGLVNAGGDLRVFGERDFDIVCRCGANQTLRLKLRNIALAVSDSAAHSAPAEHRGYYHRGAPSLRATGSVAITAPRAAVADALTKWLLLEPAAASSAALPALDAQIVSQS